MRERLKLVQAYGRGEASMAELCRRFGVSRKTGHKWWVRFCEEGRAGLGDRTSRPRRSPRQTPESTERVIVKVRRTYPSWGPRKLRAALASWFPDLELPAASTIGEVLKRNGLITRRRRRRRRLPPTSPFAKYGAPNAVWCADFKGQFSTSKGAGGLSRLSVWWIKLGIVPERIRPGHPEENGRQERFHRTLKLETARPPAGGLGAQQRRFDRFLPHYNEVRPHEALGQKPPSDFYEVSTRSVPERYVEPDYPEPYEVYRTNKDGSVTWRGYRIHLNTSLDRELVGILRVGREFDVRFGPVWLGRFKQPRRNTKEIRLITLPRAQRGASQP